MHYFRSVIKTFFNLLFIAGVSLILILPSIIPSFILADFEINKDYIARVLCIEKDVQESTCNGKCHLTNELKKAEDNKKETDLLNVTKEIVWFFSNQQNELQMEFISKLELEVKIDSKSKIQSGYISILDHPPQV